MLFKAFSKLDVTSILIKDIFHTCILYFIWIYLMSICNLQQDSF